MGRQISVICGSVAVGGFGVAVGNFVAGTGVNVFVGAGTSPGVQVGDCLNVEPPPGILLTAGVGVSLAV